MESGPTRERQDQACVGASAGAGSPEGGGVRPRLPGSLNALNKTRRNPGDLVTERL